MKGLVISHLYLFPGFKVKRGGNMIHKSLVNLAASKCELSVVFMLPIKLSYLKFFSFDVKNFVFNPYKLEGVVIYPCFYFPRLSKKLSKIDLAIKMLSFRLVRRAYFKSEEYDFVYSQTLYPDGPLARQIAEYYDLPLLVQMRGSDVHTYSRYSSKILTISKAVLSRASLILSVSQHLLSLSNRLFERNDEAVILYTSCPTDVYERYVSVQKSLNNFYFVGALVESKGVIELIEGFRLIAQKYPDSKLTIVGGGALRSTLDRKVQQYGLVEKVSFKGVISAQEEMVEVINDADVFLFPSYNEGLPNVVVEAVACERLVIATDVGGVKEIAPLNSAFNVTNPRSAEALFRSVEKLKTQEFDALLRDAASNREKVISKFSPASQQKTLQEILTCISIL